MNINDQDGDQDSSGLDQTTLDLYENPSTNREKRTAQALRQLYQGATTPCRHGPLNPKYYVELCLVVAQLLDEKTGHQIPSKEIYKRLSTEAEEAIENLDGRLTEGVTATGPTLHIDKNTRRYFEDGTWKHRNLGATQYRTGPLARKVHAHTRGSDLGEQELAALAGALVRGEGDGGSEERKAREPKREAGAIGEGLPVVENSLKLGADAADGDLGRVSFGRLDSEIGFNEANHSGNDSSDPDPDESTADGSTTDDPDTDAYLITEMVANWKQRDLLNEKVAEAPDEIQKAYRHFTIHLLTCAQIYWTDKWHPMHHEKVLIKQLPGGWALGEIEGGTSMLWDDEEWDSGKSVVQSRENGKYTKPGEDDGAGRTREYRIDPTFAIRFQQLGDEADPNYKLHEHNGEVNKVDQSDSLALDTVLRDDAGHRWGQEQDLPGGHYSLLDGALRILSDQVHKIDITEITEMKNICEEEWEQAKRRHEQAKARYENLAYVDEEGSACTEQEADQIREARSKMKRLQNRKKRAAGRYHSLLSGLNVIERQADRIEDGFAYIQNAYEVQPVSGRLTFRLGGPQGLPAVLKSFAYSMEDVYNYDIKSSQTTGLRQLAEDLRRVGYDIDTEALDEYIEKGGKDWVIRNYDLPRSLVKRVEHAIKFMASIPDSMEAAYRLKYDDSTSFGMPEIAEHVEEYYDDREEQNRVLDDFNEIFGPQVQMIEDLAEGLLNEYWDAHSQAGGRGKGRVARNYCGITFCKHDYKEPVFDEDGNVADYKYGHKARSKAMAWYLQGLEAAYVHALTILSEKYNYRVMANEHDGLITIGSIPEEAWKEARELSGARRAELTDKRFETEEDVRELCEEHDFDYPSPPIEADSCETQTNTSPGADRPPAKPGKSVGSKSTTYPTATSPPTRSETASTSARPAGGGPSGTTTPSGGRPASPAAEPAEKTGDMPPWAASDEAWPPGAAPAVER